MAGLRRARPGPDLTYGTPATGGGPLAAGVAPGCAAREQARADRGARYRQVPLPGSGPPYQVSMSRRAIDT